MEKIEVENLVTKFFSSKLWHQIASYWCNIANKFFLNFVALCLYFLLI